MEILLEKEGCTSANIKTIQGLANQCKFKRIVTHLYVETTVDKEDLPVKTIVSEWENPPLMEDTIYSLCNLIRPTKRNSEVLNLLKSGADLPHKEIKVKIPLQFPEESEYHKLTENVRKDIIFIGGG